MHYVPEKGKIGLSIEEAEKLFLEACSSYEKCAKIVFPNTFRRPFDRPHLEMFSWFERPRAEDRKSILAPRGTGKTVITQKLAPSVEIFRGTSNYIVPVSFTIGHAQQQADNLRQEFEGNELINYWFGKPDFRRSNRDEWIIKLGKREYIVMPRGSGSQVRGMLYTDIRPDCIICDDLEDPENLLSAYQREKQSDWFFGSLGGVFEIGATNWKWWVVGTLVHPHALIWKLQKDPDWEEHFYELCDDNFVSNYPNAMSDEQCKAKYESLKRQAKTHVWAREYRQKPSSASDKLVQSEWYKYYDEREEAEEMAASNEWLSFVIADPSRTVNMQSAESAVIGVSVNTKTMKIRIRRIRAERVTVDDFYDMVFEVIELLPRCSALGVEVDGLEDWIMNPLMAELTRRKLFHLEIVELRAKRGVIEGEVMSPDDSAKVSRFRPMVYYFKNGFVEMNGDESGPAEQQMDQLPSPDRFDIIDCIAYIPHMMQQGKVVLGQGMHTILDRNEALERRFKQLDAVSPSNFLVC